MCDSDTKVLFENAKNQEETCSFQGKYLHSKYNPGNEGERFAQSLEADFSPLCIFIIEPCLSYCAPFIKKRFPRAELCAIRFSQSFKKTDSLWDKVFYCDSASISLSERLFSILGEEKLCSLLAFDWPASKQIFQNQSISAWQQIKSAVEKARDVIGTRAYFSKRWLKNSIIFSLYIKKAVVFNQTQLPVVITASGPSLETSLPFLSRYRASFFLIALSSSFMPLARNGISPDIVISSDGGFWAKKHLHFMDSPKDNVYALESEGASPKEILENSPIIPLVYEDGIGNAFLEAAGIPCMLSERNGTVAGTALNFAYRISSKNIYICGLDQAPAEGFQHTQPNALETDNAIKDFRLNTSESRITASRFRSAKSLEIYRNWFITNSSFYSRRVFRLSCNYSYPFSLGNIQDKNWDFFTENETSSLKDRTPARGAFSAKEIKLPYDERKKLIIDKLIEISKSQSFIDEVFPMDSLLLRRAKDNQEKQLIINRIQEKTDKLIQECKKL